MKVVVFLLLLQREGYCCPVGTTAGRRCCNMDSKIFLYSCFMLSPSILVEISHDLGLRPSFGSPYLSEVTQREVPQRLASPSEETPKKKKKKKKIR